MSPSPVLLGGSVAAGFLLAVTWNLVRGRQSGRAEQQAQERNLQLTRQVEDALGTIQALRTSEGRWRQVVETEPECVSQVGADGTLLQMNAAGLQMFEAASFTDLARAPLAARIVAEHRPAFAALVERVFQGESGTLEFEITGLSGTRRWLAMHAAPLRDGTGAVTSALGLSHDISERRRTDGLLRWEKQALELIVHPGSLSDVLDAIMRGLEEQAPGALFSVLLLDESGTRLRHGAGPSLPAGYNRAIDGIAVGPAVGSCGTAVHERRQVIVADIATDPLWINFRELALDHGLRACWSTPIRSDREAIVGTFAVYHREPRRPNAAELELIERASSIVAIAVLRKHAEDAVRDSRERLDFAIESGDLGVWEFSPQTGHTSYSPGWARMLGYDLAETVPHMDFFKAHVHPDDLPAVMARLDAHFAGRDQVYQSEHRLRTKAGAWKWVVDRGRIVTADATGPVLVAGVVSDVTPLKDAEAALRASQQRVELAVLGSSDGLFDWDMRTNAAFFTPRWKAMLGFDDHELASDYATWEGLLHPDDRARVMEALRAYVAGEAPSYQPEFRMRTKDGGYKWILARGTILRDEGGHAYRMAGSHTDITRRKEAEQALMASQSMLEAVLDTIPVRVFWKDENLKYLGCNTAFAVDAGFTAPHEVVGRDDFAMAWREHADLYRSDDRAVIDSGLPRLLIEEPQTTPDGRAMTLLTSKVPLRGADGEFTGVLGTYLDISSRKQAEEEVRRLNAALEATVQARTTQLRHSEAQLRDLLDGTGELISSVARDGQVLFTNRAWRETLGFDEADIAGLNIVDLVHPDYRAEREGYVERLLAGEDVGVLSTVMVGKHGRACHLEGTVTIGFENGVPAVTRGIFRDVTAQKAVTQALHDSEEEHRLMIRSSRDAILTLHPPDWHFATCNPAAVDLYGARDADELCAVGPWTVSPAMQPDGRRSADAAADAIAQAMATGTNYFEWTHQRLDGTPFPATVLLSRVVHGDSTYLVATVRDITAQKRAEAAMQALNQNLDHLVVERTGQLRDSEERFRHLVESSPNAVLMTGAEGRITFANRRTEALLGYTPEELVGQPVGLLVPEMLRDRHVGHRAHAWSHPEARPMGQGQELFAQRKDGSQVAVEIGLTPIAMSGGTFMMATMTDVTLRRQAEEAVRRLAAFPEVNPNPVVELTADCTMTYCNGAATALSEGLGLPAPAAMLPAGAPEIVRECLASGTAHLRLTQRFGKRVLAWSFYPIANRGVVHGYAAEITERLQLEEQLRQSQKMEAIGQLAGGVAHDFNNILSVVMMQAEVSAMAENLPAETRDGLQEIQASAERGANLTRQLLLFSRRQVMQPRELDLNEVVTSLARMLQRIIGEDVKLELHLHATRLTTRADAGMLDQVLMNLAVNARDAMPGGGRLRVETWEDTVRGGPDSPFPDVQPGRYVGVTVSDSGSGIPPEILPRIFEPFFTTKEAGKGTGLGLATVFGIVRQHGGWVSVVSEPDLGTSFRILLPAAAAGADRAREPERTVPRGGSETVLVVEDEPGVRMLVRSILERRGYTVIEAASGVEALALWGQHAARVDLLLTDLVMPDGVNGQELATRLRADAPGLRVVFSSGYSPDLAGRELTLTSGENFLQKPFSADVLTATVRRALDAPPQAAA